jgi:hypothetical protein
MVVAMAKRNKKTNSDADMLNNAWVLASKRSGDKIGNWVIEQLFEQNTRSLEVGERCKITSCCYPPGARMVRAKLCRDEVVQETQSLAG